MRVCVCFPFLLSFSPLSFCPFVFGFLPVSVFCLSVLSSFAVSFHILFFQGIITDIVCVNCLQTTCCSRVLVYNGWSVSICIDQVLCDEKDSNISICLDAYFPKRDRADLSSDNEEEHKFISKSKCTFFVKVECVLGWVFVVAVFSPFANIRGKSFRVIE